jgi:predicted DsbA family dithiol-disulfide isomerase
LKVEIWSDIVCPFCYIGKHNFSQFLKDLPDGEDIEVINRSYELNPSASRTESENSVKSLADKYGFSLEDARQRMEGVQIMAQKHGLDMNIFETRGANTHDLHRLVHLARAKGREEEMMEALFKAHFVKGMSLNDRDSIIQTALEAGLDLKETEELLDTDLYHESVTDDRRKAESLGIRGVPHFLFDGKYAVSGAQPKEAFLDVYNRAKKNI